MLLPLYNELVFPKSRKESALEKSPCNTNLSLAVSFPKNLRLMSKVWSNKKYLSAGYFEFTTSDHEIHSASLNTCSFYEVYRQKSEIR
jgi:hypothetical protein